MITLGIDPSMTGFGWVVHNSSVLGAQRVIARGVVSTSSSQLFVTRYADLQAVVAHLLDKYPEISAVGLESPPFGESWSEGLYALFVYVNYACYLARKDIVHFDPTTVKMLVRMDPSVRRGSIDKGDVIEAVKAETGIKTWNHNAADGYIIARSAAYFFELYYGILTQDDLTPSEFRAYCRVHTFVRGVKAGKVDKKGLIFREDSRFHTFSKVLPNKEDQEMFQWLSHQGSLKLSQQTHQ